VGVEIDGPRIEMNAERWTVAANGTGTGQVTSALYSPRLKKNIGYATVPIAYAAPGTGLRVKMSGIGERRATVVPKPFVDPNKQIPKA